MILLVEVSEPAGQAQGGQAALSLCCPSCSQACIYPGSCSSPLFPPCRLLQDFLSVPLQPALICAPSAPAGASEPCPATRLVSPVSLVSLLHQDALWLCSPACLTSPSTLSALPLIFYLFFLQLPQLSPVPLQAGQPCGHPAPAAPASWAGSRPHTSQAAEVPVLGSGIAPQRSPCCAAEPIPSISPSLSAVTGKTRAGSAPAAFNPQLRATRTLQTVGFRSGIIPSLPLICSPVLPTVLLINSPSLCLHTFTLPMIGSAPFCLCSEIAP